jgi:hypothetical protein
LLHHIVLTNNGGFAAFLKPLNCPELRPLAIFWAFRKRLLKKNGGASTNVPTMTLK